jgi:hypothetical protein
VGGRFVRADKLTLQDDGYDGDVVVNGCEAGTGDIASWNREVGAARMWMTEK